MHDNYILNGPNLFTSDQVPLPVVFSNSRLQKATSSCDGVWANGLGMGSLETN